MFQTQMAYLARSKIFEIEKAFDTDYPVDHVPGARKTNHENDTRQVDVNNMTDMNHWDLDTHGFCILKAQTSPRCNDTFMDREAYAQKDLREMSHKDYWTEIEALLHNKFPCYSRIDGYDCTVISTFYLDANQADWST